MKPRVRVLHRPDCSKKDNPTFHVEVEVKVECFLEYLEPPKGRS
jgi:hypothetical protein